MGIGNFLPQLQSFQEDGPFSVRFAANFFSYPTSTRFSADLLNRSATIGTNGKSKSMRRLKSICMQSYAGECSPSGNRDLSTLALQQRPGRRAFRQEPHRFHHELCCGIFNSYSSRVGISAQSYVRSQTDRLLLGLVSETAGGTGTSWRRIVTKSDCKWVGMSPTEG